MSIYAGQYGPEGLEYPSGRRATGNIRIRNLDGTIATLYADRLRTFSGQNPAPIDSLGNLTFFAEPGRYLMEFGGNNLQIVVHEDPDEPDVDVTQEQIDGIRQTVEQGLEPDVAFTLQYANLRSQGA